MRRLLVLLLIAGCGSTVQLKSQSTVDGTTGTTIGAAPTQSTQAPATVDDPATGTTGQTGGFNTGARTSPITPTTQSPVLAGDPAPTAGATAITTPIKVGVVDLAPSGAAAAAIGLTSSDQLPSTTAVKGLVAALNAHGGIAGRRITLVERTVNTTSSNYEVELAAACELFTHDKHVDVVISNANSGYYESFERCLSKAGMPHLASFGAGATDEQTYRTYPGFFSTGAPSVERRITVVLEGLHATGYLTSKNNLGVIVEDCGYNTRAYAKALVPTAKRLGLNVSERTVDCAVGFSDASKLQSQVSSAVLPFRSAGIDRVMLVSQFEGFGLLGFTNAAQSQGYHPGYALSSTALITQLAPSINTAQLANMRGIGWQPDVDVTQLHAVASPATTRCRQLLASQSLKPATKVDDQTADLTCAPFFLMEQLLKLTKGVSTQRALIPALSQVQFLSPLEPRTSYASRKDGTVQFRPFGYVGSCSCFRYA